MVSVRRRLDAELVRRGLAAGRAEAVDAVLGGRVLVDGAVATSPDRRIAPAEALVVRGPHPRYVSRGGEKLAAALRSFPVAVAGCRVLDAGSSTGGFTDCLLQHGAGEVWAVDVGHGQLAWSLRQDPRVHVLERTNVRDLLPERVGGAVPLAVADLAFVSLTRVAGALGRLTTPDADLVLLCKPQFEAGRARVGKGGVVRDPAVHRAVLHQVVAGLAEAGLVARDAIRSPLRGADGNVEFLLHAVKSGAPIDPAVLDALCIDEVPGARPGVEQVS